MQWQNKLLPSPYRSGSICLRDQIRQSICNADIKQEEHGSGAAYRYPEAITFCSKVTNGERHGRRAHQKADALPEESGHASGRDSAGSIFRIVVGLFERYHGSFGEDGVKS
jgi:hypothetical protein